MAKKKVLAVMPYEAEDNYVVVNLPVDVDGNNDYDALLSVISNDAEEYIQAVFDNISEIAVGIPDYEFEGTQVGDSLDGHPSEVAFETWVDGVNGKEIMNGAHVKIEVSIRFTVVDAFHMEKKIVKE